MKILITGAAGFIGSHLMDRLMAEGYDCMGVDNYNDHLYSPDFKWDRVKNFCLEDFIIPCDIYEDYEKLDVTFHNYRPDIVIHLAALAGVRDSYGKEEDYHKNNIDGTWNVIKLCKKYGVKRVLYASTSCVYGTCKNLPWKEPTEFNFNGGYQLNAYGYTKYVNECQFKLSGLNAVGMRFFTVYGPWGRPDMAVYDFTKTLIEKGLITLYNKGYMFRDFTYIDDIIDGIKIIFDNETIQQGEIFNIGKGETVHLTRFAGIIADKTGSESIYAYLPKHPADTISTWSCIDKLGNYGYSPKVGIEEGVSKFVDWYKEYHKVK